MVGKEQTERTETVRDTARRTDVEVEKVDPSVEQARKATEAQRRR